MAKPEARPKREAVAEAPPATLVWAVRIALGLGVLATIPLLVEQYEAPKIWAVRAIGLGALVALPFAIRVGALRTPIDLAVLAALGVEVLTTLTSVSRRVSLLGEPLQREGLVTSVALGGIYFAARAAHPAGRGLGRTLAWFWIPAGVAAVYAFVQVAGLDPVIYARFAQYGGGIMRPFSTLGHANLLGVVMAAAACLAVGGALRDERRRPLYIVLSGVFLTAVMVTLSRGAWLGAAAGVAATLAISHALRSTARITARDLALAGATLVLIAVGVYAAGWTQLFTQRAAEFGAASEGSAGSRFEIWRSALAAFRASPVVGHGPDTFDMIFSRFQTPVFWHKEWAVRPFHAHSIYLHQLATRGVLGALVGFALLAPAVRSMGRLMTRSGGGSDGKEVREMLPVVAGMLVAIGVCGFFGAVGINGAMLATLAAGWMTSAGQPVPIRRGGGRPATMAFGVVAAAVLVVATMELTASHYVRRSQTLVQVDPKRAVSYAEKAAKLWPIEDQSPRALSEATLQVGMSEESYEFVDRAERAAREAIALVPARPLNYRRLAEALSVLAVTGDEEAARAMREVYLLTFRQAPYDVILRAQAARAEVGIRAYRRAIQVATEATRLDPTYAPAWLTIARALDRLHQPDSALVVLDRALRANWHEDSSRRVYAIGLYQQILAEKDSPAPRDTSATGGGL